MAGIVAHAVSCARLRRTVLTSIWLYDGVAFQEISVSVTTMTFTSVRRTCCVGRRTLSAAPPSRVGPRWYRYRSRSRVQLFRRVRRKTQILGADNAEAEGTELRLLSSECLGAVHPGEACAPRRVTFRPRRHRRPRSYEGRSKRQRGGVSAWECSSHG
jgi:hypothetical protein